MKIAIIYLTATLTAACAFAASGEPTGRDIAVLVDQRPDGETRESILTMTLHNSRGQTRVRKMKSYAKDKGVDTKSVMVFKAPADVKETAFLQYEYDAMDREDDRWLYMPALRKVRRISGSSNDDYFMGSDFTYDDMGDRNVDEDTHTLLRSEVRDGHDCWVLESVPVDSDDMYSKKTSWIRKDALVPLRIDYYDHHGELMKTLTLSDIKQIDGFWISLHREMKHYQLNHKTILTMDDIKFNSGIKDSIFRVSSIQRGMIR